MSNKFEYKYEAPTSKERKEIENIRKQYLPKDAASSKLERLRKLDGIVNNTPMIVSLSLGIIGSLVFGLGMTFFIYWTQWFYWGIPFAIIGIAMMLVSYPVYFKIYGKLKNKYKDEILELSNSLLDE